MLKFVENLYEVKILRKNVCYIKNNVMYSKWPFPTGTNGFNPTYAEKVNKSVVKEILEETQNYKTLLLSPDSSLAKKCPEHLEKPEKTIVYGLERKEPFVFKENLSFKTVQTKEDLYLWGRVAAQVFERYDADFIYESFKMDLKKKYADYFIFYKGKKPVGVSQVIRGAGYSAVYWVGVPKEYRKKGYGAELTKQMINYEIAHKRYRFILSATDLGLIIYKKIGFKPVETIYEYILK